MIIEERNKTSVDVWEVNEIINSINKGSLKNTIIKIPTFQRNLTWKKQQKDLFIDSLKKGFPIGSLLLYKKGTKNINNKEVKIYLLVDGLQRSNAIREYFNNPTQFLKSEDIPETFICDVINLVYNISSNKLNLEEVSECILEWIHEKNGLEEKDEFSGMHLATHIDIKYNLGLKSTETLELSKPMIRFIDDIKERANISLLKIPILIFTGDVNNLPEIFKRINKQGTQLNKYQIFAAIWEDKGNIKINNKKIKDKIKEKYDSLVLNQFEIDGYSSNSLNFYNSKFNYFEYVFGLGKTLTSDYKCLFSNTKKEDVSESIGFNIIAACLMGNVKEIDKIPDELENLELDKFEECLFGAINEVVNTLRPFITIHTNKKGTRIYHTDMHIVAIIAKVFRDRYDKELKEKSTWNSQKLEILEKIKFYYLYDIIDNNTWRGSGDSKVRKVLKSSTSRYNQILYREDWENKLNDWFENQLKELEYDRKSISDDKMLFLNYIYTHTHSTYKKMKYVEKHIEHIVSVHRLTEIVPCSINCIANLGLLEKDINMSKKDRSIFEFYRNTEKKLESITSSGFTEEKQFKKYSKMIPELNTISNKSEVNALINKCIKSTEKDFFTTEVALEELLNGLDNPNIDISEKKSMYELFLRDRFEVIKEKFYELNNITSRR